MMTIPKVMIWYQVKSAYGVWSEKRYVEVNTKEELDRIMSLCDGEHYNLIEAIDTQYNL